MKTDPKKVLGGLSSKIGKSLKLTGVRATQLFYCIPQTPSSLALDKLQNQFEGAAHPLRSGRKAAPSWFTGPAIYKYIFKIPCVAGAVL